MIRSFFVSSTRVSIERREVLGLRSNGWARLHDRQPLAKVFTMGIKAGVEPLELSEAVRQGATGRQRTFERLGRFLSGKHDPADFALRLLHKDVGLAVGLGREVGVPMRLANMAFEELTEAMNRGWSTRNSTVGQLSVPASSRPPSTRLGFRQCSMPTSRSKRTRNRSAARNRTLRPYHASRPRAGRAMPGVASARSRAAACSASCLSNMAFAAAWRLALNSSGCRRPLVGGGARRVGPAEMRHHIARVEFVGALGRLEIGPVMRLVQKGAEGALLLVEPVDQRDRVVRGAADAVAVLDKPFERVLARRHDKARLIVVGVAEIALEAELGVREGLLAGLGDVHRPDEAQPVRRPSCGRARRQRRRRSASC